MENSFCLRKRWWVATVLVLVLSTMAACAAADTNSGTAAAREVGAGTAAQRQVSFTVDDTDLETYDGLPVGFTDEGFPFRGNPDAPLTLVEYSDYLCPFCGRYFNQTLPALIESYGASGQVKFVFRDFPLTALHPTAPVGHTAALCVAEQGAALYWKMHDQLFAAQNQWANLPDPGAYVAGLAEEIGVDMGAYNECMAAGQTRTLVDERVSAGLALGFNGTPTFQVVATATGDIYPLVGAQPVTIFKDMLDSLLAGEELPGSQAQAADATQLSEADRVEASQINFDFDDDLQTYNGLPAGFTAEGFPFLGNPEAAISLVEFSDYLCPFCGRHFNQTYPALIEAYGAAGEVNFVFRDLPLASLHPTAHFGHEAAFCAGEQGAEFYWAMHDQLFSSQNQWANLPDPTDFVAGLAESSGVDMKTYESCIAAGHATTVVEERAAEGLALGYNGTPSFQVLVNETGDIHEVSGAQPLPVFSEMLDALIAGEALPEPEEPEPQELPLWANAEGLAPDLQRPGYTVAGDPYKGNPEAQVVVVEFSDFQCPACQQHALEIQPQLDEQLVETGEIMWVFKPLPLKEHPQALSAAVAAECAGDQGQFWEMHHQLFVTVDTWAASNVAEELAALAAGLDLDLAAFDACVNGRAALERVVGDMYDAQGVAETTPTFILLHEGRGTLLNGSRPADTFSTLISNILEPAEQGGEE